MFFVSEIKRDAPESFKTPLQKRVYEALDSLGVAYQRADTDEAISMEDCEAIDRQLGMKMVKTLFLCNRQQTDFYLFITAGNKPFRTKAFSAAMNISRVSFAPQELMLEKLGTKPGAATILSCLLDSARGVETVLDSEVLNEEYYGCSDGTTTCYLKLKTDDLIHTILPYAGCHARVIEI